MAVQSLREILGALVADLVTAETHSAFAALEVLRTVGFKGNGRKEEDWGDVRYVYMSFTAKDPQGKDERRTIRVPLLTLFPPPLQQIKDGEYEFFLKVSDIKAEKLDNAILDKRASALVEPHQRLNILGEVAPYTSDVTASKIPRIRIKVTLKQSDLPAGLASTLRRLEDTSGEDR